MLDLKFDELPRSGPLASCSRSLRSSARDAPRPAPDPQHAASEHHSSCGVAPGGSVGFGGDQHQRGLGWWAKQA